MKLLPDLLRFFIANPWKIFLVDGLGALLTFMMLLLVARFESFFGMPGSIVYVLLPVAFVFAINSLSTYLWKPRRWPRFLYLVATANLVYALVTFGLVAWFFRELTIFGYLYFLSEILILVVLSVFEFRLPGLIGAARV